MQDREKLCEPWLVWSNEHRAFWGANRCGYTRLIEQAGRYTKAEAEAICHAAQPRANSTIYEGEPPETCMPAPEAITEAAALITALGEENERLSFVLERDRSTVAAGLMNIRKAINARAWLRETGRGSYSYDDERYQQEFGGALDEITAAMEPLRKVARDWSDCPTDPLDIAEARAALATPEADNGRCK